MAQGNLPLALLILPGVRVRYLASHVLSLALRRLGADWSARYGIKPLLVETFVDRSRYRGTSYRAANWIPVGHTQGRGRQDRKHNAEVGSKDIWVYPLRPDCKTCLQSAAGVVPTAPASPLRPAAPPPADWAEQEFGGCKLPDARLQERLLIMARDYYGRPTANLPQACSSRAKTKVAYRFLDHEATTMRTLLPLTNNAAERQLRHFVIARRISYGTRTEVGSHSVALLASIIDTCRVRRASSIDLLARAIHAARMDLPAPSLPAIPADLLAAEAALALG